MTSGPGPPRRRWVGDSIAPTSASPRGGTVSRPGEKHATVSELKWILPTIALAAFFAVVSFPKSVPDSEHYIKLAQGAMSEVPKPFASRLLIPWFARTVSSASGIGLPAGFAAVQAALLATIAAAVVLLVRRLKLDPRIVAVFLFVPMFSSTIAAIYLPDLAAMACTAVLLALIAYDKPWIAVMVLCPAMLVRESLLIFAIVTAGIFFFKRRRALAAGFLAAATLSTAVSGKLTAASPGNIHGMNDQLYMLLKLPVNTLVNLFGIRIWTSSYDWQCDVFFRATAPDVPLLGRVDEIGLCAGDPALVLSNWSAYLQVLGVGLGVLIGLRKTLAVRLRALPVAVTVAFLYGLVMFVLGPISGFSTDRLTFYGWPCFMLAIPFLMPSLRREEVLRMAALNLASAWVVMPFKPGGWSLFEVVLVIGIAIAANLVAAREIRLRIGTEALGQHPLP